MNWTQFVSLSHNKVVGVESFQHYRTGWPLLYIYVKVLCCYKIDVL